MTKTIQMELIEARAGRDIREVLRECYEDARSLQGAADLITERYGCRVSFGTVSDWIEHFRGRITKSLDFPGCATPTTDTPAREPAAA